MGIHLLAIQARVLMWVGISWLIIGLYLGTDPITVAWRAALAACVAMWFSGKLLGVVVRVMNERIAADEAERVLAEEKAAAEKLAAEKAALKAAAAARPTSARRT
jgi:hypothetical protein